MSDAFKVGDIVQLKSGGPDMTVVQNNTALGSVETVWFSGTDKETGYFPPETLLRVSGK